MHPSPFQRVLLILVAVVCLGATAWITLQVVSHGPGAAAGPAPDPLWPAPDFALIDQDGQPFTSADLEGKVWVAEFFFTSCPLVCPKMNTRFAQLQADLDAMGDAADDVRMVAFSIDPQTDRPDVLKRYAAAYGADPARWTFVTEPDGDRAAVWRMVGVEGFKLAVRDTPDDPVNPISHSPKFVLVDRQGLVRGFYDSDSDAELAQLRRDIRAVLAEPAEREAP